MLHILILVFVLLLPNALWAQSTTTLPIPTNFRAVTINGVTTLSWNAMAGGSGYLLRVHRNGTPYDPCSSMAYCGSLNPLTSIPLVLPPGNYDAWVHTATSESVYSESQGIVFVVPIGSAPPPLVYPTYGRSVTLTWNPNSESDLAGYKVYRSLRSCASSSPTDYVLLVTLGRVVSYIDAAIPLTTLSVCYRLTAYDTSANESGLSNTAGKANQVAPGAPTAPKFK